MILKKRSTIGYEVFEVVKKCGFEGGSVLEAETGAKFDNACLRVVEDGFYQDRYVF